MTNRKDKIKNIAIIFLLIMLVLTFFSNTIMNYSLVQVSTQQVRSDSITSKVRGSGTVEANETYSVSIKESRKIATVAVKTGQEVEEGDVLFTLTDAESEELIAAREELEDAEFAYETAVLSSGLTVAERQAIENGKGSSLTDKQNALANAQLVVNNAQANVDALTKQAASGSSVDTSAEQSALTTAQQNKIAHTATVDAAAAAANDAQTKMQNAKTAMEADTTGDVTLKEKYDAAVAAYNEASAAYIKAQQDALNYDNAITNAQNAITNKVEAAGTNLTAQLESAKTTLTNAQTDLEKLNAKFAAEITLEGQYNDIKDLKEKVAELQGNAVDASIVAPISGTVTEICYIAGQTVTPEETMMMIKPENKAFTLQFSVSATQAKKIKVGDVGEVINNWYGDDISVSVASIRKDPANKSQNVVICEVSGNVSAGDNYTVSIGEKSSNYDFVVPTSCIREDSNGHFILIIESKSTPLGNRYYARRVDVEIIASDDTSSAITGALEGYEYVITTTTKPIAENEQVRLAE